MIRFINSVSFFAVQFFCILWTILWVCHLATDRALIMIYYSALVFTVTFLLGFIFPKKPINENDIK